MTCRMRIISRHHSPDLTDCASGFAWCRVCGGAFTAYQLFDQPCPGPPSPKPVMPAGAVPCRLCGAPVFVEPRHRATVEEFGTTCA